MEAKLEREGSDYAVRLSADEVRSLGLSEGQTVEVRPKAPREDAAIPASWPASWQGRRVVNGLPVYTMAEMAAEMRRLGPDFEPPTVDWGPDVGSEIIVDDDPR